MSLTAIKNIKTHHFCQFHIFSNRLENKQFLITLKICQESN
ncbi:hypothetical protein HMP0015_1848 [Acinetobacter haemolyticus ATCC 19194]|uniref:Uncharacterized protein n=1 Tax=Acinetobacter haemolyticus ATCC 19194 TaxID=707232 RepID=D4XQ56_ACIHA|nr:hypothetical protein HMP0015_1848 [Acinetobacter haemolyticus ATCC 19194]